MVYEFTDPQRYAGHNPNVIGHALEQLRDDDGAIAPERVVAHAREVSSPLHRLFEWDERRAARGYRLLQARALIRAVVVRPERETSAPVVEMEARPLATPTPPRVVAITTQAETIDARAARELRALRRKYGQIDRFAPVWDAIDAALTSSDRDTERVPA